MSAGAGARWPRATAAGLHLRDETDADLPFQDRLFASARADELAPLGLTSEQATAFLTSQSAAQRQHYRKHYAGAEWWVVERGGEPVGRVYLARWPAEHRLMDIALLPEHRGQGLGGAVLADLQAGAAAAGASLSAHVEAHNPARRLYARLGFAMEENRGVYDLIRWTPPQAKTA